MANEPTRLIRFGDGASAYQFPDGQNNFGDNFGDVVGRVTRLPGISGGLDEYGTGVAPTEVGSVRSTFNIRAASRGEMQAQRDAVKNLIDRGVQKLYMKPGDQALRWCNARVNSVSINMDPSANSDLIQSVTMQFQVADPYWYALGSDAVWGQSTWGQFTWGGNPPIACTSATTNATLNVGGNVMTMPQIIIIPATGASCNDPEIERLVNGVVQDRVRLTGALSSGSSMTIDASRLSVTRNGANAYGNGFTYLHPAWFRLFPGNNDIRIKFAARTGTINIRVNYFVRYR